MSPMRLARAKARSRCRTKVGGHVAEYLVTIGALALVVATALAVVAGPSLFKTFRTTQRAAASPMP